MDHFKACLGIGPNRNADPLLELHNISFQHRHRSVPVCNCHIAGHAMSIRQIDSNLLYYNLWWTADLSWVQPTSHPVSKISGFSFLLIYIFSLFYSVLLCSVVFSVQTVCSSVKRIANLVTSAYCCTTLLPGCSYWLLFSPADFPSFSESLWTVELNDKLLLHTSSGAQLHRLLCQGLKYSRPQTSCKNNEFLFKTFFCLLSLPACSQLSFSLLPPIHAMCWTTYNLYINK